MLISSLYVLIIFLRLNRILNHLLSWSVTISMSLIILFKSIYRIFGLKFVNSLNQNYIFFNDILFI